MTFIIMTFGTYRTDYASIGEVVGLAQAQSARGWVAKTLDRSDCSNPSLLVAINNHFVIILLSS